MLSPIDESGDLDSLSSRGTETLIVRLPVLVKDYSYISILCNAKCKIILVLQPFFQAQSITDSFQMAQVRIFTKRGKIVYPDVPSSKYVPHGGAFSTIYINCELPEKMGDGAYCT